MAATIAPLALGAVGAFFFGPVGYLIGSTIGSMLFPPPGVNAQPLQNLKLTGSSFGQMIPILDGTMRLGAQCVWQTDLTPHAQEAESGKGAEPTISGYTYTVSCALKVCKGPIRGFRRIWADSELIYDVTPTSTIVNDDLPVTFYLGVETALPDPTMEAIEGVGNVPAFRDDAAAVFTDWDVSQWGGRIPVLNFEVFTEAGDLPQRINTFTPPSEGGAATTLAGAAISGGVTTVAVYTAGNGTSDYYQNTYDFDGVFIEQVMHVTAVNNIHAAAVQTFVGCANNPAYAFGVEQQAGTLDVGAWYYNGALVSGGFGYYAVTREPFFYNDYLYTLGGTSGASVVSRWPIGESSAVLVPDASYSFTGAYADSLTCTVDDIGFVWVGGRISGSDRYLWKFDGDLNLIHAWLINEAPGDFPSNYHFTVWHDMIAWMGVDNVTGLTGVRVYQINGDYTFTRLGFAPAVGGPLISLGNGLVLGHNGLLTLNPPPGPVTLAAIVTRRSADCGRTADEIDVTALTDLVDGYAITQQTNGRGAIKTLQDAYFFDGVESSTQIKFVKRGGPVVAVISDDDLAATVFGSEPPALLSITRTEEEVLPAQFDLKYVNGANDYQDGEARARRQTTESAMPVTVSMAINMTAQFAAKVAWVNLLLAWVERESFGLTTSRKYAYLEPTDVIIAHGRTMRLMKETQTTTLLQSYEALNVIPGLYDSAPVGVSGLGFSSVIRSTARQATDLLMLDIPIVSDDDAPSISSNLYYAAAAGAVGPNWPGYALFKSSDGGTTYASVASAVNAVTMGTAVTALPTFLPDNVFDEVNKASVQIGPGGGTLSSVTEIAVLNGANKALLGNEIFQYRDATLTGPGAYDLTGLLRGRRGTEWAMVSHAIGERFVALPALLVPSTLSELGQTRLFKPVTAGTALATTIAQSFTDGGQAVRCYSPVLLGGGMDGSGNVTLNWTPRTRLGGAWIDLVEAPISESTEAYVVQIWNSTYTVCARVITGVTTPTTVYTSAMQVTDFGAQQQTIFFTVGQLGAFGLGQQAPGTAPGSGGSNTAPLAPVTPYNTAPPMPSSGCTLPVTNSDCGSTHTVVYNTNFVPGEVWVVKFTTPTIRDGAGRVTVAEWQGDPTFRNGTVSTSPCGNSLGAGCVLGPATTLGFVFYLRNNPYPSFYPTLQPSTAYYFTITTQAVAGAFAEYSPP